MIVNLDYVKIQCERCMFWIVYIIDKEILLMFGRFCYFFNEVVDQEFLDFVNDEDMGFEGFFWLYLGDCYLEVGIEQVKLNQIIDKIM